MEGSGGSFWRATNHSFPCLRWSGRRRKRTEVAKEEGREERGEVFLVSSLSLARPSPALFRALSFGLSCPRPTEEDGAGPCPVRPMQTGVAGWQPGKWVHSCLNRPPDQFVPLLSSLWKFKLHMYTCHSFSVSMTYSSLLLQYQMLRSRGQNQLFFSDLKKIQSFRDSLHGAQSHCRPPVGMPLRATLWFLGHAKYPTLTHRRTTVWERVVSWRGGPIPMPARARNRMQVMAAAA